MTESTEPLALGPGPTARVALTPLSRFIYFILSLFRLDSSLTVSAQPCACARAPLDKGRLSSIFRTATILVFRHLDFPPNRF